MGTEGSKKITTSVTVRFAAFVIIIAGMMAAQSLIAPVLMAIFIGIICVPSLEWLQKKGISNVLSVTIVLLGILLIASALVIFLGDSIASFVNNIPKYEDSLQEMAKSWTDKLISLGLHIDPSELQKIIDPSKVVQFTGGVVSDLGSFMSNFFLIFFILLFLLLEKSGMQLKYLAILNDRSENAQKEVRKITDNIRHYLSMKSVISLVTGAFIWIWLLVQGVDYPLLWAIVAFLLNFIPNIGSIIAAVPAVILSLVQFGPIGAIWTLSGYLIVNTIMGNLIEPRVLGQGLGLSTLVVFLSLIFWGFIFGAVGMFLAVPLTLAVKLVLYNSDQYRWIAILLGTEKGAEEIIAKRNKSEEKK